VKCPTTEPTPVRTSWLVPDPPTVLAATCHLGAFLFALYSGASRRSFSPFSEGIRTRRGSRRPALSRRILRFVVGGSCLRYLSDRWRKVVLLSAMACYAPASS